MRLDQTIPAMPVRDAVAAVNLYRDRLGFSVRHHDDGFGVLGRDDAEVHVWQAGDESWRDRVDLGERPVRSGAESFLAGTASCRIKVDDVDGSYEEYRRAEVLHPVSRRGVSSTDFGTREFSALDRDGNLLSFFGWRSP